MTTRKFAEMIIRIQAQRKAIQSLCHCVHRNAWCAQSVPRVSTCWSLGLIVAQRPRTVCRCRLPVAFTQTRPKVAQCTARLSAGRRRDDVTRRDALGGKNNRYCTSRAKHPSRSELNQFQPRNGSSAVPSGCVTPNVRAVAVGFQPLVRNPHLEGAKKRTRREGDDEVGRGFTDRLSASPALTAGQPWGLCWGPAPWLAV